jgi:hypothetical protein
MRRSYQFDCNNSRVGKIMLAQKLLLMVKGFVSVGDIRKFESKLCSIEKHVSFRLAGDTIRSK